MKWPIGLSTGIAYRRPIEESLEAIRAQDIRTIEVSTAPSHLDVHDGPRVRRVAERVRELGIEVVSLHAPFGHELDITDPDPGRRARSLDTMIRAADALATLGGRLFVIHPGGEDHAWVWERQARLEESARSLGKLWQACRDRGLTLVPETTLPHLLGGQLDDLGWLLTLLPREGTGICLDTSHTSLGGSLFDCVERFRDRIVHVQASDNRGVTDDHLPPGEGILDWTAVRGVLERVGYRGVFLLEIAGADDLGESLRRVSTSIREVLAPAPRG